MVHVVTNLDEIDRYIESLGTDTHLTKWLSKVLKKEVVTRHDWLISSSDITSDDFMSLAWHVQKAVEKGEDVFDIVFFDSMKNEVQYVVDWLAELEQRDARLFAKLDRITWKQAVEHSRRWHEALARQTEKTRKETIPFDGDCPVMFTHDDGMKWVWLKTDKARDDEGRIMGHCVGNGNYDDSDHTYGVFSLRTSSGHPCVTIELDTSGVLQSKMKGNADVSDRYSPYVTEFHEFMRPKLLFSLSEGSGVIVRWNGDQEWYVDGRHHREDGPAVVRFNGDIAWYENGRLHRIGDPAIIKANGDFAWCFQGNFHREDGPAVIKSDGTEEWYRNGELHREDGPAISKVNGDREWWIDGKRHRSDGPAVVTSGVLEWYVNGKHHRLDGPAIQRTDGSQYWLKNGVPHREDGPAQILINGNKSWFFDGKLHREDGPALDLMSGTKEWYFHGFRHRRDGPAIINVDGSKHWYIHGERHREDGPAVESSSGTKYWYQHGKLHREDGPAVIHWSGSEEWWINGKILTKSEVKKRSGSSLFEFSP